VTVRVRWQVGGGGAARGGGERAAALAFDDGGVGEGATEAIAREIARLDAEARRRGWSFADELTGGGPVAARVALNAVVDGVDDARAAVARGVRAVKVKLDGRDDRARLAAIRAAVPEVELRADVNGAWPVDEVAARLAALADLGLAYVEEPAIGLVDRLERPLAVPIALDESLARSDRVAWLDRVLATGAIGALILKPTVLGIAASLGLARHARAAGVRVIVTHALDGPVGTAAAAEVARAIAGDEACGLDRHGGLAGWSPALPWLGPRAVSAPPGPGLGIAPASVVVPARPEAEPAPCDRALSVRAAAAEADLGLIDDDGAMTFAELAHAAADVDAPTVIAAPTRATVIAIVAALEQQRPIGLVHARLAPADQDALRARLAAAAPPAGTFAIVFTSGSTAEPKAVVVSRRAAVAAAAASAARLGWHDDDRWLVALPLAHVGGLAIVVRSLIARRPIVLAGGGDLAGTIERHRVTLASLVPTQLEALVERGWRPPAHLRAILVGGAAAPAALIERALALGLPVLTTYGMTETFGQVATARPGERLPPDAIGRPLPGVGITAGTRARPAPVVVDSPARCAYLGDDASGPVVTADLGFVEDGLLYVVGRADDVIITGGENVHPLAVEAALARVPGVARVCVFGVPDDRWGQLVAAAIVAGDGFDAGALDRAIAGLAPHLRPRRVRVVDSLPLGPTGKVDRRRAAATLA